MPAPEENKNAEKWTLEESISFFDKAIKLSNTKETLNDSGIESYKYDFIGEVARELGSYKEIFTYLKDKFKELKYVHKTLITNLEANCFYNGKKGHIKEASAIMNLKSNHNWTDRQHIDLPKEINIPPIKFIKRAK